MKTFGKVCVTLLAILLMFGAVAGIGRAVTGTWDIRDWGKSDTEQTQPEEKDNNETAAVYSVPVSRSAKAISASSDNGISTFSTPQLCENWNDSRAFNKTISVDFVYFDGSGARHLIASDVSGTFVCLKYNNRATYTLTFSDLPLPVVYSEYAGRFVAHFGTEFTSYQYEQELDISALNSSGKPSKIQAIYFTFELYVNDTGLYVECQKPPVELPPDPVKEGHTFVGWYYGTASEHNSNGGNCRVYDNAPIYSDTALHAHFRINTYTVTFNSNGGSAVNSQTVNWNTAATLTTPTRDGYAFKGWFLPNGTQYTNQPIKANTALTARWERNRFTVIFDSDGGSAVDSQQVMLNNAVQLTTPTKTGYTFLGWYTSDGTKYENQGVTDDMTLTARWEIITYTVTFYVDNEIYETKTVDYGSVLCTVVEQAQIMNLKVMSMSYNDNIPLDDINATVVGDISVNAVKAEGADKVINTIENNQWAIIGGVVGGVVLLALIAGICGSVKRKKR